MSCEKWKTNENQHRTINHKKTGFYSKFKAILPPTFCFVEKSRNIVWLQLHWKTCFDLMSVEGKKHGKRKIWRAKNIKELHWTFCEQKKFMFRSTFIIQMWNILAQLNVYCIRLFSIGISYSFFLLSKFLFSHWRRSLLNFLMFVCMCAVYVKTIIEELSGYKYTYMSSFLEIEIQLTIEHHL